MDNILLSVVDLKCNDSQNYQLLDGEIQRNKLLCLKQYCVLAEKHYNCYICVFTQVIYMGVVLYAPALALNAGK